MDVEWTEPAERHLDEIRTFLRRRSPSAADEVVARLVERTEQLAAFSRSGPMMSRQTELRYLVEGEYRIIYLVAKTHIHIVAVVHGRRRAR